MNSTLPVFEGLETIPQAFPESTVAIGAFDGIHVGHQAIIRAAVADAHTHKRPALVFTFDRHPADLLRPERAPDYLTTPRQRNRLIAALDVDALVVARFDTALSQLSPETFLRTILKDLLGAKAIVVGRDFRFGKERAGDVAYLERVQAEFGFTLHPLAPVLIGNSPASSTRIRELLQNAEIEEAETVLGHPYLLAGRVVTGQKLGRTLGFPTANLERTGRQVVPKDGIYAVQAHLQDGRIVGGACSIGNRPTIDGAGRSIETYLLDFDADLYGQEMELRFVRYLRQEAKFDSLEALKAQMAADIAQVRAVLT